MAGDRKRPDSGDVEFEDWDSALDEWDAKFETMVEPEAPRAPQAPGDSGAAPDEAAAATAASDVIEVEFDAEVVTQDTAASLAEPLSAAPPAALSAAQHEPAIEAAIASNARDAALAHGEAAPGAGGALPIEELFGSAGEAPEVADVGAEPIAVSEETPLADLELDWADELAAAAPAPAPAPESTIEETGPTTEPMVLPDELSALEDDFGGHDLPPVEEPVLSLERGAAASAAPSAGEALAQPSVEEVELDVEPGGAQGTVFDVDQAFDEALPALAAIAPVAEVAAAAPPERKVSGAVASAIVPPGGERVAVVPPAGAALAADMSPAVAVVEDRSVVAMAVDAAAPSEPPIAAAPVGQPTLSPEAAAPVAPAAEPHPWEDPFADTDGIDVTFDEAPSAAPSGPVAEDAPPPARRTPAFPQPPTLSPPAGLPPRADEEPAQATQARILFEHERQRAEEPGRRSALGCAAARAAERSGEPVLAQRLYEAALGDDPACRPALRALRRLALGAGDARTALAMVERELGLAGAAERDALAAVRAELLLALGAPDASRAAFLSLAGGPLDLWARAGMVDAAAAGAGDLRTELAALAARIRDPAIATALAIEQARLAPPAAADTNWLRDAAEQRSSLPVALALLRVALRQGDHDREAEALERLEVLAGGELRGAVRRRLAALRLASDRPRKLAEAIALLAGAGDAAALALRLQAEEAAGDAAAAEATLAALADTTTGEPRCDYLLALAEHMEARGDLSGALRCCELALVAAPGDPRACLIADRLDGAVGGDPARDRRFGETDLRGHARQLAAAGRTDEAVALLAAIHPDQPEFAAAVEERVDLLVAGGRHGEAAQALQAAATARLAEGNRIGADLLFDRTARLFRRAGAVTNAASALRSIAADKLSAPSRRRLKRLLEAAPAAAAQGELAELLRDEASQLGDSPRAGEAWYRHGLASAADRAASSVSWRRALECDPDHSAALAALEASGDLAAAAGARRRRADIEPPLPPVRALAIRWRAALGFDGIGDAASAAPLFDAAFARADSSAPLARMLVEDRLLARARQLADRAAETRLLELLSGEGGNGERVRALVRVAERHVADGNLSTAIDRYQAALALRVAAGLVRPGLERALFAADRIADLDELLLADLGATSDLRLRVPLLERIALLESEYLSAPAAAQAMFESLLEIDHANHVAFRALERRYLVEDRPSDRIALYARMGRIATDPRLATALILERVRLRRQQQGGELDDLESDLRWAVLKDPRCRPALRQLLAIAESGGTLAAIAEVCDRLAADPDMSPQSAAVFLWEAADALLGLGRADDAISRYRLAQRLAGDHAAGLRARLHLLLSHGAFAEAATVAETAATALRDPTARLQAVLVAAALADDQLGDAERALAGWRKALAIDPAHEEAFARTMAILDRRGDHAERARALAQRAATERDVGRAAHDHVELAMIYRDRLHDPTAAREHLDRALSLDPAQPAALVALADLHLAAGSWTDAADALIKSARIEKDPDALAEVYVRLGVIYTEHLPDPQRAMVSFTRVLQHVPDHPLSLSRIAALYEQQGDFASALQAVGRMSQIESDPAARVSLLLHGARLQEALPGGERNALELLRRALALDPLSAPSIVAIADFFERHGDAASARVQLDTAAQLLRQHAAHDPLAPGAYRGLFQVFTRRGATDAAFMAASVLAAIDAADERETAFLSVLAGGDQPARAALASRAVDELLFDPGIPTGFRNLIAPLDEALGKLLRGDVKRFGVGRAERLAKGNAVRDAAAQVAADLGLDDVDVYVTHAFPAMLAIELTEPLSIVIGDQVVAGASERELRFLFARQLKPVQAGLGVALRSGPDELGVVVGGLVRQFVPDFVPAGCDPTAVAQEAARMQRLVSRKLHQELVAYALECTAPQLDWRRVSALVVHSANRAGLLASGSVTASLAAVRRLEDQTQLRELLCFAVSDEAIELRRLTGVAVD